MSLYLVIWIVICFFGIKDFLFRATYKVKNREFKLLLIILLVMLTLRFGQGTDYFAYRYIYNRLSPDGFDFSIYSTVHGEIGYLILCNLFRYAKLPYEFFIACTAVFQMLCFARFCKYFKIDTPFVLVLAYPTLYMTYFTSAIRQGIVAAVYLGILIPMLLEKKYKSYIFVTVLCSLIHSASIVFIFPMVLKKIGKIKVAQYGCVVSWIIGFAMTLPAVRELVMSVGISGINYYMKTGLSISIVSVFERLIFLWVVSYFYFFINKAKKITEKYQTLYLIYLTSMSIYGVFLGYSNIASRMSGVMRFVELFLLIYAIRTMKFRNRLIIAGFFVLLESLMLVKNINSYIVQGNYDDAVTIATYSYVSIFNENRIYKIRHIESKYLAE